MKQVKQYQILEEGRMKLTLTNAKEFDSYMLTMMHECTHALSCQRKQSAKSVFYYDISEKLSLHKLFSLVEFSSKEACGLLCQLWKEMEEAQKELPLFAQMDTIYYDPQLQRFSFVILPIHDHHYENDWNELLKMMAKELKVSSDSFYGCLYRLSLRKELSTDVILEQLLLWRKQHTWKEQMQRRMKERSRQKERRRENEQRVAVELRNQRFVSRGYQEETKTSHKINTTSSNTVVLFPTEKQASLKDELGHCYTVKKETLIGRQKDCDIVLAYQTVSAHHARIKKESRGMMLSDLGSSNGTFVNGKKIKVGEAVMLHHQDKICFAQHQLIYEEDEDEVFHL